ncbi:MAG: hypothetical protein ACW98K_03825 [Candidatus Kariarchaeaceae archaeon]|jgi:methionine synthase II (cobalamin-independent)
MTKIRGAISGTYPFGEELILSIMDFKYGRSGKDIVKELFHKELLELINLQEQLGVFPIVSTGSFGIEDLIRPFTRSLSALKSYDQLGDLPINRFHYTNTFFRQPSLVQGLPAEGSVILEDIHTLSDGNSYSHEYLSGKQAKIILPGPVTFSSFIDSANQDQTRADLIEDAGSYLAAEVAKLPSQYVEIQFDEPTLVWDRVPRALRPAIVNAYEEITGSAKQKKTIVSTYFESCENIISFLLDLPVSGIGIDFLQTNILSISEQSFEGKVLQAGILDAQNYVPNSDGTLNTSNNSVYSKFIGSLLEFHPKELVITSTTGLEYLPRDIANQRLQQTANIINLVEEK